MKKDFVYGIHAVISQLQLAPESILSLKLLDQRQDRKLKEIAALAEQLGLSIEWLNKKQFDQLLKEANHQGACAVIRQKETLNEHDLFDLMQKKESTPLFLILDGIQDPHNLGAILRSADGAAVTAVIIPKDRSVKITPIVQKIASGAALTVPLIEVTNLVRTMESLKKEGIWIMGATEHATESIYKTDLKGPIAIVLGGEGEGLRRLTEEHCDLLMKIPMLGMVSSLNVSVSAGIILFEAVRQRS